MRILFLIPLRVSLVYVKKTSRFNEIPILINSVNDQSDRVAFLIENFNC